MKRLDRYMSNTYSQFGEDGVIAHIFDVVGPGSKVAVEFGAGDGLSCSNSARLWREEGWAALLIEGDAGRFADLEANTVDHPSVVCRRVMLTPTGVDSITSHIADCGFGAPDFMSIDIDGDDYFIFKELTCEPRVISIEFNPTIPPHIVMYQAELGAGFGASLLALIGLAKEKGYTFIGATYCNAFFVRNEDAGLFADHEVDLATLFPVGNYTFAVTDYLGRLALVGQAPPWQAKDPLIEPVIASAYVTSPTTDVDYIRRAFERSHGPALWLSAEGLPLKALRSALVAGPPLICLDLTRATFSASEWMEAAADAVHYRSRQVSTVLAFIRNP